ncbi:hypothetical protein HC356_00445 [Wolbachia pipientis]|uniref:Uncharacterized protein n=1 Tax=Wolbachia pipientis TaxID=955 RepID=A0A7G5CBR2_WOLPI|nr:hypothetical protein HC356_00445 [Wolbachia pipientis]
MSWCHPSAYFFVIPVPRHWDPEDVISTKWLHNKGWIPVPSIGMTSQGHWNDTSLGLF